MYEIVAPNYYIGRRFTGELAGTWWVGIHNEEYDTIEAAREAIKEMMPFFQQLGDDMVGIRRVAYRYPIEIYTVPDGEPVITEPA